MAELIDITEHFAGYVTLEDPEPWDGTYPAELEGETGRWQIVDELMYVAWEGGNPCEIRTWTTHINSSSFDLPDEIVLLFEEYNMAFADSLESAPDEGSGDVLAIAISDPDGAIEYVRGAIEPSCRNIEVAGISRGNFGVSIKKVA